MAEPMLNTDLTLSAAPDLLPEDARIAARIFEELGRIERARRRGNRQGYRRRVDRLIDYVRGSAA